MFTIPSLGLRGKWLASRAYSQYIFNRTFPEPLAWLEYTSGAEAAEVWSIFLALSIPGHSSLLLASRVCLPRMLGVYHGTNLNWQEWCPKEQPRSMTAGTWGINRPTPYFLISNNSPRSHQWDETPRVQWELPWHLPLLSRLHFPPRLQLLLLAINFICIWISVLRSFLKQSQLRHPFLLSFPGTEYVSHCINNFKMQ